jgi:hypothetical protein
MSGEGVFDYESGVRSSVLFASRGRDFARPAVYAVVVELLNCFAGISGLTRSAPCRRCEPYTWASLFVSVNKDDARLLKRLLQAPRRSCGGPHRPVVCFYPTDSRYSDVAFAR